MAEKVIIELEAKTDKALKGIEELQKSNKELSQQIIDGNKKQVKATNTLAKGFKGVGLAMKAAGFGLVMKIVDGLSASLMKNQEIADTVNTVFTAIGIVFKQVSDVMLDVFKNVSDATGGFDALQKVLGGALSISINLVVGAIQGMMLGVKKAQLAWEDSFLGGKDPETIKRLNLDILEIQENLIETGDRIVKAGGDIADNFVEAVGEVGQLAQGVAEGVSEAIEKIDVKTALSSAKRVVENKKNYGLLEAQSRRLIEQYDLEAETQRQIRDDDRKSIEERIQANNKLGEVLNKQSKEEKEAIQARIGALQQQVALEGESAELNVQLYDLNTELLAIDAKVAGFKSEQLVNEAALQKENIDLLKTKQESENILNLERKQFNAELIENEYLRLQTLKDIALEEGAIEEKRLIDKTNSYKKGTQAFQDAQNELFAFQQANGQQQKKLERDINVAKQQEITNTLGNIAGIVGQNSKFGKAIAVVQALRDTYSGANKALAQGGIFGFIGAAAVIAGGIANVKQITATKDPQAPSFAKGGGGSASVPSVSTPSVPSLPPAFNVVGASDTNQLADAIGSQSQEPTRAYVVSNDVTTAQSMDRNIVDGASI